MREMNASDFKAKCLAVLDEVARTGEPITVLKRGQPVAQVVRASAPGDEYPQRTLAGTVRIHGDIVGPALPAEAWESEAGQR